MSLTTKGQNKSIHPDHEAVHQSKSWWWIFQKVHHAILLGRMNFSILWHVYPPSTATIAIMGSHVLARRWSSTTPPEPILWSMVHHWCDPAPLEGVLPSSALKLPIVVAWSAWPQLAGNRRSSQYACAYDKCIFWSIFTTYFMHVNHSSHA
jgi:hypothetical protein